MHPNEVADVVIRINPKLCGINVGVINALLYLMPGVILRRSILPTSKRVISLKRKVLENV